MNLGEQGFIHAPSTDQVGCQFFNKFEDDFDNASANQQLIAASPELLEALVGVVKMMELAGSPLIESITVASAKAAIAKATGC